MSELNALLILHFSALDLFFDFLGYENIFRIICKDFFHNNNRYFLEKKYE